MSDRRKAEEWIASAEAFVNERASIEVNVLSELDVLRASVGVRVRVRSTGRVFVLDRAAPGIPPPEPDGILTFGSRVEGCVWRLES